MRVSFVIPARNEEAEIGATLESIQAHTPAGLEYEIIVVDNGSTDRTVSKARDSGARVIEAPDVRLGDVRNVGAREAAGDTLVFLDADVSLTPEWERRFGATLSELRDGRPMVTGSWCEVDPEHWIDYVWELGQHREGPVKALGGAHIVIGRREFDAAGGFPPDAESGEDEELCRRAWEVGIPVVADPRLRVLHRGVATSLRAFFRRHQWHGVGDLKAGGRLLGFSVTSVAALAFAFAHLVALVALVAVGTRLGPTLLGLALLSIVGLPAARAFRALRHGSVGEYVRLTLLYYVYFWARASAWYLLFRGRAPTSSRAER